MASTWGASWGTSWATSWNLATTSSSTGSSGASGGGQTPRRADFGLDGKRHEAPVEKAKAVAKRQADKFLEDARNKALEALEAETKRLAEEAAKREARKQRKLAAAMEAVKQLEAHKAILADDEEVLMLFVQVISQE